MYVCIQSIFCTYAQDQGLLTVNICKCVHVHGLVKNPRISAQLIAWRVYLCTRLWLYIVHACSWVWMKTRKTTCRSSTAAHERAETVGELRKIGISGQHKICMDEPTVCQSFLFWFISRRNSTIFICFQCFDQYSHSRYMMCKCAQKYVVICANLWRENRMFSAYLRTKMPGKSSVFLRAYYFKVFATFRGLQVLTIFTRTTKILYIFTPVEFFFKKNLKVFVGYAALLFLSLRISFQHGGFEKKTLDYMIFSLLFILLWGYNYLYRRSPV
jgi:hypothetical protein